MNSSYIVGKKLDQNNGDVDIVWEGLQLNQKLSQNYLNQSLRLTNEIRSITPENNSTNPRILKKKIVATHTETISSSQSVLPLSTKTFKNPNVQSRPSLTYHKGQIINSRTLSAAQWVAEEYKKVCFTFLLLIIFDIFKI